MKSQGYSKVPLSPISIPCQFYRLIVVQIEAAASAEAEKEKERKARRGKAGAAKKGKGVGGSKECKGSIRGGGGK